MKEPEVPTMEERLAFESWLGRWEAINREAEQRGWLKKWGYEEDPEPYSPLHRYQHDKEEWDRQERMRAHAEEENAKKRLKERANAAANAARRAVMEGRA